nr:MAG TPA: hypothetical protein [Caudoviricetes sp.]
MLVSSLFKPCYLRNIGTAFFYNKQLTITHPLTPKK